MFTLCFKFQACASSTENTRNNTHLKKELAFKIFEFMIQFTTFIGVILGAYVAQHIFRDCNYFCYRYWVNGNYS